MIILDMILCVCVRLIMNQSWSFKGNKRNFCLFVFSGLLCSWILSSTHYKCIYTSTQPTFIYPVFSVFWLAAPNIEREKKTANNIKNDFCANRNNNNNEKWFKVSIVYGTQKNWMSCECVCVCACEFDSPVWRAMYALTNRLKCKTSHFNI